MRRLRWFRGDAIGRMAEWTADHMGSARFLGGMTVFVLAWFSINAFREFDPDFWILNVIFSTMASYAAPLILLAQNRTAARDKIILDNDRAINLQARSDMEYLTRQIIQLRTSLTDLPTRDAIRDDVDSLQGDLRAYVLARRQRA